MARRSRPFLMLALALASGGTAAYPSSVLMNAIPAKVAGVGELIMVVPTPDGEHNQLVLAAAALAGVDRVFCIGGAQAVGALAYGTATVPQVDAIVLTLPGTAATESNVLSSSTATLPSVLPGAAVDVVEHVDRGGHRAVDRQAAGHRHARDGDRRRMRAMPAPGTRAASRRSACPREGRSPRSISQIMSGRRARPISSWIG